MVPKILLPSEIKRILRQAGYDDTIANGFAAVSKFETGNFSSAVFKENNNLFGMRLPRKRSTTATSSNLGHAVYNNRLDSIYDLVLWLDYTNFPKAAKNFYGVVREMNNRNYFEVDFDTYYSRASNWL